MVEVETVWIVGPVPVVVIVAVVVAGQNELESLSTTKH